VNAGQSFFALDNVSKRYGGVHALRDVDFACAQGSIHAVLGENGAGKVDLMKIMAGVGAAGRRPHDPRRGAVAFPIPQPPIAPASSASSRSSR
jgi:ribose transport system ATP-binding protein